MIETTHKLIPASSSMILDLRTVRPRWVWKALDEQNVPYECVRLGDDDREFECTSSSDEEIFKMLDMDTAGHVGEQLICTAACVAFGHAPFKCVANKHEQIVQAFEIEKFFELDVVILCEQSQTITLYDHNGIYAHVDLKNVS